MGRAKQEGVEMGETMDLVRRKGVSTAAVDKKAIKVKNSNCPTRSVKEHDYLSNDKRKMIRHCICLSKHYAHREKALVRSLRTTKGHGVLIFFSFF